MKTIEDRVSAIERRAEGFLTQVASLAKWVKDIHWKTCDLFRTSLKLMDGLEGIITWPRSTYGNGVLSMRLDLIRSAFSGDWRFLNSVSDCIRSVDMEFSLLAGKQAILPEDSDAKEIPGLADMKPIQDHDSVGTVAERLALLELAADMVQAKIATLTESIQGIHFRAAAFWGIDPSLFFNFQPTAQEIAEIEAKTGRRLFPPKQRSGLLGWLSRIFGKGKA